MESRTVTTVAARAEAPTLANMPPEIILCIVDNVFELERDDVERGYKKSKSWAVDPWTLAEPKFERFQAWKDVLNFAATCKDFYHLATPLIYRHDVKFGSSSALMRSVKQNNLAGVERALSYGADIHAGDRTESVRYQDPLTGTGTWCPLNLEDQVTPIHWSAYKGHHDLVSILLRHGADVNYRVRVDSRLPIFKAVMEEQTEMDAKFDYPVNFSCRPFQDNIEQIEGQLFGVNSNLRMSMLERGANPLYFALLSGSHKAARRLIKAGSRLITHTGVGLHALHQACDQWDVEMVRLILEEDGVDVDIRDARGNTPLHYIQTAEPRDGPHRVPEIIELLMKKGANVNAVNALGLTPLQTYLAGLWHPFVAVSLIRWGSDLFEGLDVIFKALPKDQSDLFAWAIKDARHSGYNCSTTARDNDFWVEGARKAGYAWFYKLYHSGNEAPEDMLQFNPDEWDFWWWDKLFGKVYEQDLLFGGVVQDATERAEERDVIDEDKPDEDKPDEDTIDEDTTEEETWLPVMDFDSE
ncbi:hypothetical protein FZEAL_1150 [Fusarium zealandicum]|uniref:Ankyrin n=1 Tax=Fusarium zealandicum TaxID=1053134 RepID=A0A8H4XP14_9HYPO|nr:hypothetical protein FZEAL_1150 [Fusarium zealandicum]